MTTAIFYPTAGGANQPAYGVTNDTTEVELVAAPTEGRYRAIYTVSCLNLDATVPHFRLYVRTSPTARTQIDRFQFAAAGNAGDRYSNEGRWPVYVLHGGQSLVADLSAAVTTQAQWAVAWGEPGV